MIFGVMSGNCSSSKGRYSTNLFIFLAPKNCRPLLILLTLSKEMMVVKGRRHIVIVIGIEESTSPEISGTAQPCSMEHLRPFASDSPPPPTFLDRPHRSWLLASHSQSWSQCNTSRRETECCDSQHVFKSSTLSTLSILTEFEKC